MSWDRGVPHPCQSVAYPETPLHPQAHHTQSVNTLQTETPLISAEHPSLTMAKGSAMLCSPEESPMNTRIIRPMNGQSIPCRIAVRNANLRSTRTPERQASLDAALHAAQCELLCAKVRHCEENTDAEIFGL